MLEVVGVALLVVAVLGGLAVGPWLVAALVARRRRQPDLVVVFGRRASTSALVLGVLAVLFSIGRLLGGVPLTAGLVGLGAAGLLLVAAGVALRRLPLA
ncbi:hypothetical protein [Amnibacterium endophyticum]|uniref:Uncharacterized protein n=1 Tax=Amnibacterium endophyticum TaxID=2109337 RepID=A0ABW4LB93_9MICO